MANSHPPARGRESQIQVKILISCTAEMGLELLGWLSGGGGTGARLARSLQEASPASEQLPSPRTATLTENSPYSPEPLLPQYNSILIDISLGSSETTSYLLGGLA